MRPRETLETLFGSRWVDVARFNRIDRRHAYPGISLKIPRHLEDVAGFTPMPQEYPLAASEAKFILIDLAEQFGLGTSLGKADFEPPDAREESGNSHGRMVLMGMTKSRPMWGFGSSMEDQGRCQNQPLQAGVGRRYTPRRV